MDPEWCATTRFGRPIAHGLWTGALVSTVLGTQLPGPGTIFVNLAFEFRRPVFEGDQVETIVRAIEKKAEKSIVVFRCEVLNAKGKAVIEGPAEVIAPTEKLRAPRPKAPDFVIRGA